MITAEQEKDKYERMWAVDQYREQSPGLRLAPEFLKNIPWKASDSLIDLGCGTGRAAAKLAESGLRVTLFDIVDARDKSVTLVLYKGCLWDPDDMKFADRFDWIYCTDVLEHIPTEHVDATLDNIAKLTGKGGMLQIALFQDGFGRVIGETLHLTIQPAGWWMEKIGRRWNAVRYETPSGYLIAYLGKSKEA